MGGPSRGNSTQARRHEHLCSRKASGWVWKEYAVVGKGVAGSEVAMKEPAKRQKSNSGLCKMTLTAALEYSLWREVLTTKKTTQAAHISPARVHFSSKGSTDFSSLNSLRS